MFNFYSLVTGTATADKTSPSVDEFERMGGMGSAASNLISTVDPDLCARLGQSLCMALYQQGRYATELAKLSTGI